VGWGPKLHGTKLTQQEQLTHITLWSLCAAPLLIGCDMTKLDNFTQRLLMNDEVLAVNQDRLGKAARRVSQDGQAEVWSRPLADGSLAVGLFNTDDPTTRVVATWEKLGLSGPCDVRDLWMRKDIGTQDHEFGASVPEHGCRLLKISKGRQR
jgi:alpha-galactosidase